MAEAKRVIPSSASVHKDSRVPLRGARFTAHRNRIILRRSRGYLLLRVAKEPGRWYRSCTRADYIPHSFPPRRKQVPPRPLSIWPVSVFVSSLRSGVSPSRGSSGPSAPDRSCPQRAASRPSSLNLNPLSHGLHIGREHGSTRKAQKKEGNRPSIRRKVLKPANVSPPAGRGGSGSPAPFLSRRGSRATLSRWIVLLSRPSTSAHFARGRRQQRVVDCAAFGSSQHRTAITMIATAPQKGSKFWLCSTPATKHRCTHRDSHFELCARPASNGL